MARIEMRVRDLAQFFDSFDPAPNPEQALDPRAEAWLLDCAGESPADAPLELRIHVPRTLAAHREAIVAAIHAHFRLAHAASERHLRRRMAVGRRALLIGLAVLAACLLLRSALAASMPWAEAASEGLLILGWVVLWRPLDVLLFERWEIRHQHALLERMARVPIEFADDA